MGGCGTDDISATTDRASISFYSLEKMFQSVRRCPGAAAKLTGNSQVFQAPTPLFGGRGIALHGHGISCASLYSRLCATDRYDTDDTYFLPEDRREETVKSYTRQFDPFTQAHRSYETELVEEDEVPAQSQYPKQGLRLG